MTFDPGIHFGIPMEDYRAAEGICQSDLKEVGTSPRHYLTKINADPEKPTDAQRIGQVVHSNILETKLDSFVVRPEDMDYKTKAGREWRDRQTVPILTKEEAVELGGMMAAVRNHPTARSILDAKGNNEVCCWKTHKPTGLLLKGRADRVTTDNKNLTVIADLKTCQHGGGNEEDFSRDIWRYGYDVQAAFYLDLFGASFFVFIVVEKEPPFAVSCYNLSPESIALGRHKYEGWLQTVKQCTDSGIWPAYGEGMKTIGVPEWVLRRGL